MLAALFTSAVGILAESPARCSSKCLVRVGAENAGRHLRLAGNICPRVRLALPNRDVHVPGTGN